VLIVLAVIPVGWWLLQSGAIPGLPSQDGDGPANQALQSSQGDASALPAIEPVPETLAGDLQVRVENRAGTAFASIDEPSILPVRDGDRIQIEASLNAPAYMYLVWIDGAGQPTQLYPYNEIDHREEGSEASEAARSPADPNYGWTVGGAGGEEAILLLARRTPLPADASLTAMIGTLAARPVTNPDRAMWIGRDEVRTVTRGRVTRAPISSERLNDPLVRRLDELRGAGFELAQAVRFPHVNASPSASAPNSPSEDPP
jgi:hypothetical protein